MAKQNSDSIIELKSVSKHYGLGDAENYALRDFDLTVKRGEFIMIMGPSGCGKTTLLNIIGLLDKANTGEYKLNGKPVNNMSSRKKAHFRAKEIGFIFQSFNLIPDLTIIDNVTLPLVYNGVNKTRRLNMADSILSRFGLREREYYYPSQLSGGQQQRAAIARSLISSPSIILADEPTGNLDSRASHIIMEELKNIHSLGNTIIMVTHNPALTAYATRVINMLDGEIDTDIKTVDDSDLPKPGEEKVPVRFLKKKSAEKTIEKASKSLTGNNGGVITTPTDKNSDLKPKVEKTTPKTIKASQKAAKTAKINNIKQKLVKKLGTKKPLAATKPEQEPKEPKDSKTKATTKTPTKPKAKSSKATAKKETK